VATHAANGGAAALDDGMDAELATYTGLQRQWKAAVVDIREHLHPGERVLVTAAGAGQLVLPAGVAVAAALLAGAAGAMKRGMIVAATDRRLLLATCTMTGRNLQGVQGIGYEQIQAWKATKRDVVLETVDGIRAYPHQMQKDRVVRLRTVVEPRLRPGVVQP
jgi:hypothetical protein